MTTSPQAGDIFGAVFDDTLLAKGPDRETLASEVARLRGQLFYSLLVGQRLVVSDSWLASNPAFVHLWNEGDGSLEDFIRAGHVVGAVRSNESFEALARRLFGAGQYSRPVPHPVAESYWDYVKEAGVSLETRGASWRFDLGAVSRVFDRQARLALAAAAEDPRNAELASLILEMVERAEALALVDPVADLTPAPGEPGLGAPPTLAARHIFLFDPKCNRVDPERFSPLEPLVRQSVRMIYQRALMCIDEGAMTALSSRAHAAPLGTPENFWKSYFESVSWSSPKHDLIEKKVPILFAAPQASAKILSSLSFKEFRSVLDHKAVADLRPRVAQIQRHGHTPESLGLASDYANALPTAIRDTLRDTLRTDYHRTLATQASVVTRVEYWHKTTLEATLAGGTALAKHAAGGSLAEAAGWGLAALIGVKVGMDAFVSRPLKAAVETAKGKLHAEDVDLEMRVQERFRAIVAD